MTIIKTVTYAAFGDPRSRDRDLETLKPTRNGHSCLETLLICL